MELFKTYLKTSEDDETLDATRHSVVVLMGTLAPHLNNEDDEVWVAYFIDMHIIGSVLISCYWNVLVIIMVYSKTKTA